MLIGEVGDPAEGARLIGGDEMDRQHLEEVEEMSSVSWRESPSTSGEVDDIGGFQRP